MPADQATPANERPFRPGRPTAHMNTVETILAAHAGRAPQLLAIKWAKLRENPFAFFRGTAPLFYSAWAKLDLPAAPTAWICGDAHLENVGSYKGDNRVPYFDLNDFDEACLAPAHWDLGRALTGLLLLGDSARARQFLEAYRARLRAAPSPQDIERGPQARLGPDSRVRRAAVFAARRRACRMNSV